MARRMRAMHRDPNFMARLRDANQARKAASNPLRRAMEQQEDLSELDYKELQERAKKRGLKYTFITREDLEASLRDGQ